MADREHTYARREDLGRIEALKPGREELRKLPGYYETPGKVWRTGVGYVDGYRWGVKLKPNDGHGKLSREAEAVGELMRPHWEAGTAHEAEMNGSPGDYGLRGMPTGVFAEGVHGDWCPNCDHLRHWCECNGH